MGDYGFLEATKILERTKRLRVLRVVRNNNDSIAVMPMVNFHHVGFLIRLYSDPIYDPEITYPKVEDSYWNKFNRHFSNQLAQLWLRSQRLSRAYRGEPKVFGGPRLEWTLQQF